MLKVGSYWIPDDPYFKEVFSHTDFFEIENLEAALKYVKKFEIAVDGGAHVGSWSRYLAHKFDHVIAFEPQPENYACLCKNVPPNVLAFQAALGDKNGSASLKEGSNSGCWHLGTGQDVAVTRLGDFGGLDLLKLDVEGYEYFALKGAEQEILKYKPVVIIEEKKLPHSYGSPKASQYLESLGYTLKEKVRKDQIWAFDYPD